MPLKILVVDDEPQIERLILQRFRRQVRKKIYEFTFASNGQEGLQKIEAHPDIDIVLCDINMPVMDGLTFLGKLLSLSQQMKVVMISAYGDMKNIRNAMNKGAYDFVVKPIDFHDLEITVEKANSELSKLKEAEEAKKALISKEQELVRSKERTEYLRELDELKSRFFTNISHEFRTPLTVILGMVEHIEEKPERWLSEGINIIRRNSGNLLRLINQILDLRKLESGKLELDLVQADIVEYLHYLIESFQGYTQGKNIDLNFLSENEQLIMDFDPDKLLQIISNLLSNAIKFTPEGGEISVQVTVGSQQLTVDNFQSTKDLGAENCLLLTVKDTGVGIPREKLSNIFDRFYQVDDSSTRKEEGTGIGLSLVKELIKLMDGSIEVESTIGKGTTFKILLPIRQDKEVRSEELGVKKEAPVPNANSVLPPDSPVLDPNSTLPTLLIIEDNADVVKYLSAALEDKYQLIVARDGEAGIEIALEKIPDIIISDVMMPKKDGYEVCKTLKEDERTSHIPIVMLTAKADDLSRLEGLRRGAEAYLTKPFKKEELFIRIEKLLELRKALQLRYQSLEQLVASEDVAIKQEDEFILKVRQLFDEHLDDERYGTSELCRDLGMSRTQVHRKIKALTNRSTSRFLRFIRLSKAREMLLNSTLNVAEIAYTVGFSDPNYFSRTFAEEYGEPPTAFRG